MCKWIKDILFPTNVLGKKKKCIKYPLPSGYTSVNLDIECKGEMVVSYTRTWFPPNINFPNGEQKRVYVKNETTTITIVRANQYGQRVGCKEVYFNCTNVTRLIVNGEQLI